MLTAVRRHPLLNLRTFLAFYESRPKGERWELLDGTPVMMPPPRLGHQRIASNLERHLNAALLERRPEWRAEREIGVVLPGVDSYRPEPELTIVDRDLSRRTIHAMRFYLVAEVMSPDDDEDRMQAKLDLYRIHPDNCAVILIHQEEFYVMVEEKGAEGTWTRRELTEAADLLAIEAIGPVCTLAELYLDAEPDRR